MKKILLLITTLFIFTANAFAKDIKVGYNSTTCGVIITHVKVVGNSAKEWGIHVNKYDLSHPSAPGCKIEYVKQNNFLNIMGIMYFNDPAMVNSVLIKLREAGIIGDFDLDPQIEGSLLYKAIQKMGAKYYPDRIDN